MKIGRFKVKKYYREGQPFKWAVMAINDERQLVVCTDETRRPKELLFDLQYDACGYLQAFIEFWREDLAKKRLEKGIMDGIQKHTHSVAAVSKKTKNRAKAKLAKKARKRNR
jgi:hypothetical protein